jgi:hypothetical protein
MAEENQSLRLQFGNMSNVGVGLGGGGGGNKIILQETLPKQNDNIKLISVSDDEDEDDDDSSSEEEDDVSSNNEDSENEEDESDNETETHIIKINHDNFNLSTDEYAIFENINQDENENVDEIVDGDSESESDAELDTDDEINIDENDSSPKVQELNNNNHDIEHLESFEPVVVDNNIKSIHLDLEQLASSADEIKDISIFKSMNDPDASSQQSQKVIDTADFKKMSITKLREIISKQGATDASKLKKNEILKLLGVEQ